MSPYCRDTLAAVITPEEEVADAAALVAHREGLYLTAVLARDEAIVRWYRIEKPSLRRIALAANITHSTVNTILIRHGAKPA